MDEEEFEAIVEETAEYSGKETFAPDEHQRLKDAVFHEEFQQFLRADSTYFVLGNYDDGPRENRLELVKRELEGAASFAFLMKDIPEGWEFWPVKFQVLATRASWIVPVLEDSEGSHQWEAGNLFQDKYRAKVYILKREYETEAKEHEHFSAMVSNFVQIIDRDGRVCFWTTAAELLTCAKGVP
jgi:hypothetical protein